MAIHSSILTWRIQWIEEPGGLQSVGSQRVGYELSTEHARSNPVSSLTVDASFLEVSTASLSGVPESHQQRTPPLPPHIPHLRHSAGGRIASICKRRGWSLFIRGENTELYMLLTRVHSPSPGGGAGLASSPAGPVVWSQACCCGAGQGHFPCRGAREYVYCRLVATSHWGQHGSVSLTAKPLLLLFK